ncbi:uncharacterized protein [Miscanthus floridulus]|uniref:uncharacterized protein n=1 Tax=Miscanthus floridulus TaxID=154761 RepID=UPI0034588CCE
MAMGLLVLFEPSASRGACCIRDSRVNSRYLSGADHRCITLSLPTPGGAVSPSPVFSDLGGRRLPAPVCSSGVRSSGARYVGRRPSLPSLRILHRPVSTPRLIFRYSRTAYVRLQTARRRSARPASAAAAREFAGRCGGPHNAACFCGLRGSPRSAGAAYLASRPPAERPPGLLPHPRRPHHRQGPGRSRHLRRRRLPPDPVPAPAPPQGPRVLPPHQGAPARPRPRHRKRREETVWRVVRAITHHIRDSIDARTILRTTMLQLAAALGLSCPWFPLRILLPRLAAQTGGCFLCLSSLGSRASLRDAAAPLDYLAGLQRGFM